MEIFDPAFTGDAKQLPIILPEHSGYAIAGAACFTLKYDGVAIIRQHIAFDVLALWYYVLIVDTTATLRTVTPRNLNLLNLSLGSNISVFAGSAYKLDLKHGQFQLISLPAGSYDSFYPVGIYKFLQFEISAGFLMQLLGESGFNKRSGNRAPRLPEVFGGLSVTIPVKATILINKILHNDQDGAMARLMIESAAKELVPVCIAELQLKAGSLMALTKQSKRDFEAMRAYIISNIDKKVTADKVCDVFKISRTRLYMGFKRVFNITVRDFINEQKIEMAKQLLTSGYSVGEVAAKLGYMDSSNFIRLFKGQTGQTPAAYKGPSPDTN